PRWRAHRVHAVQRESQRTQGPPARGQCGRAWTAEGCGTRGADGATCGDFRAGGRTRAYRARAGRGSGAVEWRSAGSDELGGPGVDRGASAGDAVETDRIARALSQALAVAVRLNAAPTSTSRNSCGSGCSATPRPSLPSSPTRILTAT